MRSMLLCITALFVASSAFAGNTDFIHGDVIVKFKTSTSDIRSKQAYFQKSRNLLNSLSQNRDVTLRPFETDGQFALVHANNTTQVNDLIQDIKKNADVEYAEPNYVVKLLDVHTPDETIETVMPNDPNFKFNWGLENVGQKDVKDQEGIAGVDIGATQAWSITTGSEDFALAVIDSGIDYNHDELKDNIFINKKEITDNGIDDDGNGLVDDVHGWNFVSKTNDPMDDHFHGTHVSGTIGARGNNGLGTAGINWKIKMLPVKAFTEDGTSNDATLVESIKYSTKMGVKIMNNSWGNEDYSQAVFDAIDEARKAGILFVVATGNDSKDIDASQNYPAAYNLDNIISVAASDNRDNLAKFSNYGAKTVHLTAPGVNIYSTFPLDKGAYGTLSGTSMAAPHVTGAAALLWSMNPELNYQQIKERVLVTTEPVLNFTGKTVTGGRLNVFNALMDYRKSPTKPNPPGDVPHPKKPGA